MQPWYLDATCGRNKWSSAIYQKGTEALGVWPYFRKKKYGITYITMPPLTPWMGPHIVASNARRQSAIQTKQKEIVSALIDLMPKAQLTTVHAHPQSLVSLPLALVGYEVHRRYTYQIDLSDDAYPSHIDPKQLAVIGSAESHYELVDDLSFEVFYDLNEKTFSRQEMSVPYEKGIFQRLDSELSLRGLRTILGARDAGGSIDAAIYLVHDRDTIVLLAVGSIAARRDKGGIPWLIHQALQRSQSDFDVFDFEGSMIPDVERFFRSFGGRPVSYDRLVKTSSRWMNSLLTLVGRV